MRFINTVDYQFNDDPRKNIVVKNGYAILSHRWKQREILYRDVQYLNEDTKAKSGFAKLAGACALSKKLGYDWLWIDTCCINKPDHTELSEAINSMYKLYAKSDICIAYLEDVTSSSPSAITNSVWFTRGWTLQELIAPKTVKFYNRDWNLIGDKKSLSAAIFRRTKIPEEVLSMKRHPFEYSIAQRMSWAAGRETGRVEDRAYSLLGLFRVNMQMVYGEGERAFERLQRSLVSESTDQSIFVWDLDLVEVAETRDSRHVNCGLLAPSPASFANSHDVVTVQPRKSLFNFRQEQFDKAYQSTYYVGQDGLHINLPAIRRGIGTYQATLDVERTGEPGKRCAIFLVRLPDGYRYARRSTTTGESTFMTATTNSETKNFVVPLDVTEAPPHVYPGFWLRRISLTHPHILSHDVLRRIEPDVRDRIRLPNHEFGTVGVIRLTMGGPGQGRGVGWIKLGFDGDGQPICFASFPDRAGFDTAVTREMAAQASAMTSLPTNQRASHALFSDAWIEMSDKQSKSLPLNSYDSRLGHVINQVDHGFNVTFQGPTVKLKLTFRRVKDHKFVATNMPGEVWEVTIECS